MSKIPYEWLIGWRYTRAGRASGRNGFISFISLVSVIGIALGVAALIIVLSVMNGFQKEVRDRMLAVVPHVEIQQAQGQGLDEPERLTTLVRQNPDVLGSAPFVSTQVLLARSDAMRGAMLRGIDPKQEAQVSDLAKRIPTELATLAPGAWHILLGRELALSLDARVGDQVTVLTPSGQVTPAGVVPRLKQMTVTGILDTGHFEYDSALAWIQIDDAQRLMRLSGPAGLQLRLKQPQDAPTAVYQLSRSLQGQLSDELRISDWTQTNRQWYDAVRIEKRMMGIILTLIVAVAAFNLVSTLVMTVTDKRSDIAILRTLGASPRSVMGIFLVQGSLAGVMGTLGGLLLGLVVAFNIGAIVNALETLFHVSFLPASIYLISHMPSDPQASDIVPIVLISLALAFLATLYPSWQASRVRPAEALRYE